MDTIPLVDLKQQFQALAPTLLPHLEQVLASGQYINGPHVTRFERLFAEFLGSGANPAGVDLSTLEVVGCNSGTDALYLPLRVLGVGVGDEVITSAFSFFASAEVISQTGARPVFVDIDPTTFNLDPAHLAERITPRTKAIIPVHLFGRPADMTAVLEIARQFKVPVVEDCAQATGACWAGQQVGTIGSFGSFSFFPTKNLGGMGDGGAVCTLDPELAKHMRVLKDHGQSRQYFHDEVGMNSRLDALQAAILTVKLPFLREWNQRRIALARTYERLLSDIEGLALPAFTVGGQSVWNQYTLRILGGSGQRDQVQQQLQALGISARVYYPVPLPYQPVYQDLGHQHGDFPMAELCAGQVLSIPCFPELTESQQHTIADGIRRVMQSTTSLSASSVSG